MDQARPYKPTQQAQHAQQAQHGQQAQHAQHRTETCAPAGTSAEEGGIPSPQSDAFASNRSASQFSAVRQAQQWIAQQQQQRKQQQQQQSGPFTSESEHPAGPSGFNGSASGFSHSTAGNSKPGVASGDEPSQALPAAQLASATQAPVSLEARSNSTDAIREAQRKTMAFLAARDPKRTHWGHMGDQAVDSNQPASSVVRHSSSSTSARPLSWGQMGMQLGQGSVGVSAAPSSSSRRQAPFLGSPKVSQPSAPSSSSWQTDGMQSPLTSLDRMQSQELLNAVKVRSQAPFMLGEWAIKAKYTDPQTQ